MELYSDSKDFVSVDVFVVLLALGLTFIMNYQASSYVAGESQLPTLLAIATIAVLGPLLWSHWRLEFDLAADMLKLEGIGFLLIFAIGGVGAGLAGTPENVLAVPELRVITIVAAALLYSSICAGISVAAHTLGEQSSDVPGPDDL